MRNALLTILCLLPIAAIYGQYQSEEKAVIQTIQNIFDGMRSADSAAVGAAFSSEATLHSVIQNESGQTELTAGNIQNWLAAIASNPAGTLDEQIWLYDVQVDGQLATAWTPYTFYRDGQLSHCGTNAWQLFHNGQQWQVIHVTDTRRKTGCITVDTNLESEIGTMLDLWHQAAAEPDFDQYFGLMTPDAIFMGTDASERWDIEAFKAFSKPYFDNGKAWSFTPHDRFIMLDGDGKSAWFDEQLDTPFGICRGSGVVKLVDGKWQIVHYNLAVLVPNDLMNAYIKLLEDNK